MELSIRFKLDLTFKSLEVYSFDRLYHWVLGAISALYKFLHLAHI